MSLVTLHERLAVIQMIGNGNGPLSRRDRTLFSLAKCTIWTDEQRALVNRMLDERPRQKVGSADHVA